MLQPNFYYDSQKAAAKSSFTHKVADITSNAALGLGVGTAVGLAGAMVLGGVQAIVFSGIAFATLGAVVGDSWWKTRMTVTHNESSTNNVEVFEAISQFRATHPEITSEMIIASLKKLEDNSIDSDSSQQHS